jgi:hypothetical protein
MAVNVPSLNVAVIQQFGAELITDFQKKNARLAGLVRRKDFQPGNKYRFQLYGTATAPGPKSSQGLIPVVNPTHRFKDLPVSKEYLGAYVDRLEMLEADIDERGAVRSSLVYSFARRRDRVIQAGMDETTKEIDVSAEGMSLDVYNTLFNYFGDNDIEDDGQRYFAQSHGTWLESLEIPQFSKQDFLPEAMLPYGMPSWAQGKMFMTFMCFTMTDLLTSAGKTKNWVWTKGRVAYGVVAELTIVPSWENTRDSWFFNCSIDHGSVALPQADTNVVEGVVRVLTQPNVSTL